MQIRKIIALCGAAILCAGVSTAYAQGPSGKTATDKAALAQLKKTVEQSPDNLEAHQAYIEAAGIDNPSLPVQYDQWIKRFPASATVPFAIGNAYTEKESPKAKPYLLKAVAINPKLTQAWGDLWYDADRWGNFTQGAEYLRKATESDPMNADFAFYYANTFRDKDTAKYRALSLDVAKRFPNTDRGAQSLYWLAGNSEDTAYKIGVYELLKNTYDPDTSGWASGGVSIYYDLLLTTHPRKAAAMALELRNRSKKKDMQEGWQYAENEANNIADAIALLDNHDYAAARTKLADVYGGSDSMEFVAMLKARATGDPRMAYDSLMKIVLRKGSARLRDAMVEYGKQMGKDAAAVDADIYQRLMVSAEPATPFTLKRYLTPGTASLEDFKGKVVLLTYWFPGCGPCRGEFPHFEHVYRKFKGQPVAYVGINIEAKQNAYVVPFMKQSGYSFTPLEEVKDRKKGNMDNRNAAPVNFLLDQQGRIVFKRFRTDKDNEDDLEMMIHLLLTHSASQDSVK